ncbi:CDP-glycerol--glycerophosphate glycerophosphotransferase [Aliikangiella marina]|uniref:CDP-glycerol--glycerophosphate glycerophosphotransferase n=1 Tax=Aliikangiella marina TaxID=1712262 RepID=A0A545TGZ3_9GAMM|nr:CDP-glycerol--glycerophosphate glycerophosphotransferase [Aliikangiella marina]TQV76499.1 CDP-glycerol--glycerophosphate glycerophosphotransferase [Aliikangiella marina]
MARKYLFYISQNTAVEILRPLQNAIYKRGDDCCWFVTNKTIDTNLFGPDESYVTDIYSAIQFKPDVVFATQNNLPSFIPGFKVQIFNGLDFKKSKFFEICQSFDLYCTQGKFSTLGFNQLAKKHLDFNVVETGWPKLDPLYSCRSLNIDTELPIVLYAPSASPALSSAQDCFSTIKSLAAQKHFFWLIKLPEQMNSIWADKFKTLSSDNVMVDQIAETLPMLRTADVMLSDTSSIISEFLQLIKPVVSYNNAKPDQYLINIKQPHQIEQAILYALSRPSEVLNAIYTCCREIHPYKDGLSSERVLLAVDKLIQGELPQTQRKPLNLFDNLIHRKKLGYWRIG